MRELPNDWRWLSLARGKRDAFRTDLYFREGWADLAELAGDPARVLSPVALLTFKPDAIVGRRMGSTMTYLKEHGFVPIVATTVRHTHHSVRELYRFTWDIYTIDRLELVTAMHTSRETPLILLRDEYFDGGVPAAVRLSDLKGSSAPERRRQDQLRAILRPPNEVINFVHVADEPADVIRELAVFLERGSRRALLHRVVAADPMTDLGLEVAGVIARLEQDCEPHDFDFAGALARLQQATPMAAERLQHLGTRGNKMTWQELCSIIRPQPGVDFWDFVSVASEVLDLKRDGTIDLLPRAETAEWARAAEELPVGTRDGAGV